MQNLVTHPKGEARVPGFASHTHTTDTIGERKFLLGEQHRTNQVPKYEMILPGKPVTMDHLEQVDLEPILLCHDGKVWEKEKSIQISFSGLELLCCDFQKCFAAFSTT